MEGLRSYAGFNAPVMQPSEPVGFGEKDAGVREGRRVLYVCFEGLFAALETSEPRECSFSSMHAYRFCHALTHLPVHLLCSGLGR